MAPSHPPTETNEAKLKAAARGWESMTREVEYWIPEADIEGQIPKDLNGTFFRNGPGLSDVYGTPLKHPIDGDGMICALQFSNGRVHFRSKFVDTWQHHQEQIHRAFLFRGQMGTSNAEINSKDSWALAKAPLLLRDVPPSFVGSIHSQHSGPDDLGKTLPVKSFAAHFRVDPINRTLVTLSLKPEIPAVPGTVRAAQPPLLVMNEYDEAWRLIQTQRHNIPGLNYSHDFLLTENYYILHMTPFVKLTASLFFKITLGLASPGETMKHYPDLPSRFVVIPRDPKKKDQIRQFDTRRVHIYHFGNVSEKTSPDGTVQLVFNALCLGEHFTMEFENGVWLSNASVAPGFLMEHQLTFNSNSIPPLDPTSYPKSVDRVVESSSSEFPVSHPGRHGLPCRYLYLMSATDPNRRIPFTDIVKYDSLGPTSPAGSTTVWKSHGIVGEPCFAPKDTYDWEAKIEKGSAEATGYVNSEDDGYVVVQVYVPKEHRTDFVVLDAKHVEKGPIARIKLRHHLPYGFHGTWCSKTFVDMPKGAVRVGGETAKL
ncbi:carotenoid oxygenase [Rhizoclosmatium globosum]|uniref:Carotenoid oxygenase n=1 Tax=Rhizoclosmatium globosum TaxID=329046 RepID=A0A1Y2CBS1_9FUNG|nr:carotenoid oxygenase [Rhizoclosmatium globosum]|eukprot:ORY44294.1 carotenoid oxygenase [Rhizoclosmatium globosum]